MTYVPPSGRQPNSVLLVGEAPGREEADKGRPFVGKAGQEQDAYLRRHGLSSALWRKANVVPIYKEGNPDPTAKEIREWTPELEAEVESTDPELIVAVGAFATRWFLGEGANLEIVHGLPHYAGAFDTERAGRANGAIVVPVYHPAGGFYDNEARSYIAWDYEQVAQIYKRIEKGEGIRIVEDGGEGGEYIDVSGEELALWLSVEFPHVIGLDTEGTPDDPWSIQISTEEGRGYVLRVESDTFQDGIKELQFLADRRTTVVMHNAMYDVEMCRVMGLNLSKPGVQIWDTMYASYLLRLEPQGLKPLAWRWCGVRMESYSDVIGDVGTDKQLSYLSRILERKWEKPEPQVIHENDGSSRIYKPQRIERRVEKILIDYYSDKRDKDGNPVDVRDRWFQIDSAIREPIERELGPLPVGTLSDIPLFDAIEYSGKDADIALRLYYRLSEVLESRGLSDLMSDGMYVLPIFEEIQSTGMPASRSYFHDLSSRMTDEMFEIGHRISQLYYGGQPFNPASPKQVAALLRRRGLKATKRTDTGAMSTSKNSIEHLRYKDPAISDVFEWRERQHIRDSFCQPVLDRIPPDGPDIVPVRCQINVTRTATRRPSAKNPNLLNIPTRKELGKEVRKGYMCEEGFLFGSWDFSQIEARFFAHVSEDEVLCRLFNEGRDIHAETAAMIFGVDLEDVTHEQRRVGKTINFGIFYGLQGEGLSVQLRKAGIQGWGSDRCDKAIRDWFRGYKGAAEYIRKVKEELEEDAGVVKDHWGMPRYLPGIYSKDRKVAAEAGRMAVSHKVQGGAQGMLQRSMKWLRPRIWELREEGGADVRWSLQVYDEIILRFEEGLWETVDGLVVEGLERHHGMEGFRVPVEAEGNCARSWGELK